MIHAYYEQHSMIFVSPSESYDDASSSCAVRLKKPCCMGCVRCILSSNRALLTYFIRKVTSFWSNASSRINALP